MFDSTAEIQKGVDRRLQQALVDMDPKIVQAAEQQMRRSAPEQHFSKRQKTSTSKFEGAR